MADVTAPTVVTPQGGSELLDRLRRSSEFLVIPLLALVGSAILFSLFLLVLGKPPLEFYALVWKGAFGTWFSLQNTLVRASPLILTALCVAIPARLGMVIIGGEGALALGGFAAAVAALPFLGWAPPVVVMPVMFVAAAGAGALWIGLVGWMRHYRGINETIASLLMYYIAVSIMNFFVEGALRDPGSPIKASTAPIGKENMIGLIPGSTIHWGLVFGLVLSVACWVLMNRTTFGFAARVTGGNVRAAQAQGLPVGRLVLISTALAGAAAGLAGFFEVAAIQGKANASLLAGYGFAGILVSFLARHNPLAIVPVAIFIGGLATSGGIIQRRLDLPDATVLVLQGLMFVVLLISETLYGRFEIFRPKARS